jgi:hypothetical protein
MQKNAKNPGGTRCYHINPYSVTPPPKKRKKVHIFRLQKQKKTEAQKILTKMHLKIIMNRGYPPQMGSERPSTGRFYSDFAPPVGVYGL